MLPGPSLGLVVRYEYLWHRQSISGATSAEKERPACVVLVFEQSDTGRSVILLPITHTPPMGQDVGIPIPPAVKRHLGLDERESWIIVTECNVDDWPSPDLRQVPGRPGTFAYGHIPPKLFRTVSEAFLAVYRDRRLKRVKR